MEPQPADAEVGVRVGGWARSAPPSERGSAAVESGLAQRGLLKCLVTSLRPPHAPPLPLLALRPCSLILISEQIYGQLKQQVVASQMPDRQQHLAACLEKLMTVRVVDLRWRAGGWRAGQLWCRARDGRAGREALALDGPSGDPLLRPRAPLRWCRTCSATWSPRIGTSSRRT